MCNVWCMTQRGQTQEYHIPYITHHTSHVTHHTSHITHHTHHTYTHIHTYTHTYTHIHTHTHTHTHTYIHIHTYTHHTHTTKPRIIALQSNVHHLERFVSVCVREMLCDIAWESTANEEGWEGERPTMCACLFACCY